jgi:Na+/H+-dicarboxylate symporter
LKKIGLLPRLILAIILGIAIGSVSPLGLIRVFSTFSDLFAQFLSYMIPFIIIGFVATGISDLGEGAGKLLGITVLIAYVSTTAAGLLAFAVSSVALPAFIQGSDTTLLVNADSLSTSGFIPIQIPPVMGVMTALVTAFLLGLGMASLKSDALKKVMNEFQIIVEKVIRFIIIPLLPIHIFALFANMSFSGEVAAIMSVFGVVIIVVILTQLGFILIQYGLASLISGKNPIQLLKNMMPAYFTAIGTQSSAATIPVTLKQVKENDVTENIAEFTVPLCATIHLSGSTIGIVACALAVSMMTGGDASFSAYLPFILMLGVTMIAAPGIPGGAVMAALGILDTMLGFDPAMLSLMIAIYMAQDSFGTACNVTGDGAIAVAVDTIFNKKNKNKEKIA